MAGKQPATNKSLKLQLTFRCSRLNKILLSSSNILVQSPHHTWRSLRGHLSGVTLRPQVTRADLSVPSLPLFPLGTEGKWQSRQRTGPYAVFPAAAGGSWFPILIPLFLRSAHRERVIQIHLQTRSEIKYCKHAKAPAFDSFLLELTHKPLVSFF